MEHRVLFVDDDSNMLRSYRRMVKSQGLPWDVSLQSSGHEAMRQLHECSFDAAVFDVRMPLTSGIDLLKMARATERNKSTPVLMITGYDDSGTRSDALSLGAADVLSKPVDRSELTTRLNWMIYWKQQLNELHQDRQRLNRKIEREQSLRLASRLELIARLSKAAEQRDQQTGHHVVRVASYCREICDQLGVPEEQSQSIVLAAPLHDIGKIGVPDAILLKRGPLTPAEWNVMRSHCDLGASILSDDTPWMIASLIDHDELDQCLPRIAKDPVLLAARAIAQSHHEKWDGSGYPQQLVGEDIPMEARIVAIADVFDSLRSARPYKDPFSMEETLEIVRSGRGSHFDPSVCDAFLSRIDEIIEIQVRLSDTASLETKGPNDEEYSLCRR